MKIATTTKGLVTQLNRLLTSENDIRWLRAAVVYALLESGRVESVAALTDMKLPGLKVATTVSSYKATWTAAIADGIAKHVELGATVRVPEVDFDKYWTATQSGRRNRVNREKARKSQAPKPPRTQSALENVENSIRSVEIAIKKESDSFLRQQLRLNLMGLQNTLGIYRQHAKAA